VGRFISPTDLFYLYSLEMDASKNLNKQLKLGATIHKNTLFAEFDRIVQLPDGQPKYDRVAELENYLVDFKKGLDYFVNDTNFPPELRNELRIMAISVQLKINALENRYMLEKSFFKPNINDGFAPAPTTPTTAVPTISTPGGKRSKSRKHKSRQRKTKKSSV